MPIKRTFRDASLVGATTHFGPAAAAEKMKRADLETLWMGLADSQRGGLVAHAKDAGSDGWTLADWRGGFPFLAHLDDAQASALLRVAVAMAGGAIVEEDAKGEEKVTDTQAGTKKAKGD